MQAFGTKRLFGHRDFFFQKIFGRAFVAVFPRVAVIALAAALAFSIPGAFASSATAADFLIHIRRASLAVFSEAVLVFAARFRFFNAEFFEETKNFYQMRIFVGAHSMRSSSGAESGPVLNHSSTSSSYSSKKLEHRKSPSQAYSIVWIIRDSLVAQGPTVFVQYKDKISKKCN